MTTNKLLKASDCEMQVVCGKQWTELRETDQEGIRFCGDCKKAVFYTKTAAELRVAAEKGLCVYIVPDTSADKANNINQLTRERIRQIEAKTLKRLRGPTMGVAIIRRDPDIE